MFYLTGLSMNIRTTAQTLLLMIAAIFQISQIQYTIQKKLYSLSIKVN